MQRQARCNAAYCLLRKNGQEATSSFGYPIECALATTITFGRISNGEIKATLKTSKNDHYLNTQSFHVTTLGANVDLQLIVDVNACARYLTKYISKSEPRSKASSEMFANCVSATSVSMSASTVFRKCMIKTVGERDYGAQETAHLLFSLPLYRCTYNFVTLSLDEGN